jgi:peptidoglycan hydrolase-like protein with peptidoglycan-binding domain
MTFPPVTVVAATAVAALTLASGAALAAGSVTPTAHPQTTATAKKDKLLPRSEARQRPTLKTGAKGIWVKRVQRALDVRPRDAYFGKKTGKSVRKFRKSVGLKAKKKVNTPTWRHLGDRVRVPQSSTPARTPPSPPVSPQVDTSRYPTLQRGDYSAWVLALQNALRIKADSDFGPKTEAATRDYQSKNGLPVTGMVTSVTWVKLGSAVVPPTPDITITELARSSRAHRTTITVAQFANSATAQIVIQRESGGNCAIVSSNGRYHGKWQMDANFWSFYGGPQYAAKASQATCGQQDIIARAGWIDRWWAPWPTAL